MAVADLRPPAVELDGNNAAEGSTSDLSDYLECPATGDTNGPAEQETGAEYVQRKAKYLLGMLDRGEEVPLTESCPLHVARFGDDLLNGFEPLSGGRARRPRRPWT